MAEERPEVAALVDEQIPPETFELIKQAMSTTVVSTALPKIPRLSGSGASRYETVLAQEGLAAPADRPIPDDLNTALAELGALRDVLIHRAGRVDKKALDQAPSLHYTEGQLVRLSNNDFRVYSAAVRCYGAEIQYRPLRNSPNVTDAEHGPNLNGWRNYYRVGA